MYMGDPRESLVSLDAPGVWEADNRVEERWQWGAQVMDLCGLSPEDYKNSTAVTVKTIQDCGECGGGNVANNNGEAAINDSGKFSIVFEEPVASTLYIFGSFKDSDFEEFDFTAVLPKGSKEVKVDISSISQDSPYEIVSLKLGFKEDGSDASDKIKDKKYEYTTSYEGSIVGKTYAISVLCTKTESLTPQDYLNIIQSKGEGFDYVDSYEEFTFDDEGVGMATFYALCTHIDHFIPEDEQQEFFNEHSKDFIILTQDDITEIKEDFTVDTENWVKGNPVVINDSTFDKWLRRDLSGAQCPSVIGEEGGVDYQFNFTITINQ